MLELETVKLLTAWLEAAALVAAVLEELGLAELLTALLAIELLATELAAMALLTTLDLAELIALLVAAVLLATELAIEELTIEDAAFAELLANRLLAVDEGAMLLADETPITGPVLDALLTPRLLNNELVLDVAVLDRLLSTELPKEDNCALDVACADESVAADEGAATLLAFELLDEGTFVPPVPGEEPAPPPQPTKVRDEPTAQKKRIFLLAIIIRMSCPIVYSCVGNLSDIYV